MKQQAGCDCLFATKSEGIKGWTAGRRHSIPSWLPPSTIRLPATDSSIQHVGTRPSAPFHQSSCQQVVEPPSHTTTLDIGVLVLSLQACPQYILCTLATVHVMPVRRHGRSNATLCTAESVMEDGCRSPCGATHTRDRRPPRTPKPRLHARFSWKCRVLNLLGDAVSVAGKHACRIRSSDGRWDDEFSGHPVCSSRVCMPGYAAMHWLVVPQWAAVFAAGKHA